MEAYADIKSGNSAPAEPLIQIALKGDPRAQAMGQLAQGASQEASGSRDAAKASYDQAAKTDPTLLKAYLAKAMLLYGSHPTIDERNEANQALTAAFKMQTHHRTRRLIIMPPPNAMPPRISFRRP